MIPKIIHYCWFGGREKPPLVHHCIKSWERHLPEYDIREWSEATMDASGVPYVREAMEAGKWAFVADYVRFKALHECGGMYFDADFEVMKAFPDALLDCEALLFGWPPHLATLMMGFEQGSGICQSILQRYESMSFSPDLTSPMILTDEIMERYKSFDRWSIKKKAFDRVKIYTVDEFDSRNGYGYHHWMASWQSNKKVSSDLYWHWRFRNDKKLSSRACYKLCRLVEPVSLDMFVAKIKNDIDWNLFIRTNGGVKV